MARKALCDRLAVRLAPPTSSLLQVSDEVLFQINQVLASLKKEDE